MVFKRNLAKQARAKQLTPSNSDPSPTSVTSEPSSATRLPVEKKKQHEEPLDRGSNLARRQIEIQDAVLPLVFGSWLQT